VLPITGVRLRDAWALFALALLPACLLGGLGLRALASEDAAIQREASLAVEATAARLAALVESDLEAATRRIPSSLAGDDAAIARAIVAPAFGYPIVLDASGALKIPSNAASTHEEDAPARCEEERRALPASRAFLLESCEHARAPSGRFVWPILALDPFEPALLPRLEAWTRLHRNKLPRDERAAMRADAVRAQATSVVSLLDDVDPRTERLLAALSDPAGRRELREGALRSDALLARLRRIDGGRFAGIAADRESISAWLASAAPDGLAARLVEANDPRLGDKSLHGVASLGPQLRVLVAPSDPRALERRTTRSRRVLATVAAGGALFAAVAALAMFARIRAERRNALLRTDFVSTVSHELRTPLASIRMLSELLEEDRVEEGERKEVHEALARESRRMSELVERLLGFGRMAEGRVVARRERARIDEIVREALDDFEAREPSVTVVRELPEVSGDVDKAQLRVAIDNLLVNARKYANAPHAVRLARVGDEVTIAVEDRGPGIAKRDRKRIFQPFERGDERLARTTEGTGLGLALVAQVAKAHDGRVLLDSEVGRGSTFTLRIRA
jgi:two-component system phosphate regulon sensor histidine kinase PhoR